MIRDPSDGSVREHQPKQLETQVDHSKSDDLVTSGLREPSQKSSYQERLTRSREWLEERRKRKA